jgi:hypothetical protein
MMALEALQEKGPQLATCSVSTVGALRHAVTQQESPSQILVLGS